MWKYGAKYVFWFLVMIAILTAVLMLLWNWLVPKLFDGKMISYWQAMGLLVMVRILTGLGKTGSEHFKYKIRHGWHSMPDEEKARLREKFKDRWCHDQQEDSTNS